MAEARTHAITSAKNPRFKALAELLTGKGLRRHGLALISGRKQVAEALARHAPLAVAVIATPASAAPPPPGAEALERLVLDEPLFAHLDVAGTQAPMLLVRIPEAPAFVAAAAWPPGCTLFVGFQNPENVGSVIRTAAAFGVARVVLLREAAHPFLPKSSRAAGPALLGAPLLSGPSIQELAVSAPLIALDAGAPELDAAPWPATFGLLAGLEGPGLPPALRHGLKRGIAMEPGHESLNAATAIAIALYAWRRGLGQERP